MLMLLEYHFSNKHILGERWLSHEDRISPSNCFNQYLPHLRHSARCFNVAGLGESSFFFGESGKMPVLVVCQRVASPMARLPRSSVGSVRNTNAHTAAPSASSNREA